MELQYCGSTVWPKVTKLDGTFASSVFIRDAHGKESMSSILGRFVSHNAASNFAIAWALAYIDGRALPRPPYQNALVQEGATEPTNKATKIRYNSQGQP
ncbi:hypothetical protein [Caballeronia sordidicola]|uniref:hypothetical protein n=1 Tax=Caballeronia sordidicola TaxID=196367 RepID=UPI00094CC110|nr:hypothetical protein [Caballeronia sordidicola]